jgi:hypothetical protein
MQAEDCIALQADFNLVAFFTGDNRQKKTVMLRRVYFFLWVTLRLYLCIALRFGF